MSNTPTPTFSSTYAYDSDQLLQRVGSMTISRDASTGLVTGSSVGVVNDSYTYNQFGEIIGYQAGSLYSYSLVRDALGRITQKTETIEGVTTVFDYSYNSRGWLTQAKENGAVARTYTYDNNGNRTSVASNFDYFFGNRTASVTTANATYNDQDQIITHGALTFVHNANGEMISRRDASNNVTAIGYSPFGKVKSLNFTTSAGAVTLFNQFYDADQQLAAVTKGTASSSGTPSSFSIDRAYAYSFGRMSAQIPTANLNGSVNVGGSYEYGSKGNVPDLITTDEGVLLRVISDHFGSVRLVVSVTDGVVRDRIDYDEFGRILNVPKFIQPFGFAGGILYSTPNVTFRASQQQHLVGFGARIYDPELGRWTSKDPILFNGGQANLFMYVNNDPVNNIDPSGLASNLICRPVGGSGGSAGGMHCFLRISPEAGSSLGTSPLTLSLLTPDMKVGNKYINADVDSGPGTFNASIDNGRCNTSAEQDRIDRSIMGSFNSQPNGTPYSAIPFGDASNSNAFIRRVLDGAGLQVIPNAPFGAVGY